MCELYITEGDYWDHISFSSVTKAYQYYVKYYATFAEHLYYQKTTGCTLSSVTDKKTMKAIFKNVFSDVFIKEV